MLIPEANNTIAPVPKPGTTINYSLLNCYYLMRRVRALSLTSAELRLYYYPPVKILCRFTQSVLVFAGAETPVMETRRAKNPESDMDADGRYPQTLAERVALNYRQSFLPDQITR